MENHGLIYPENHFRDKELQDIINEYVQCLYSYLQTCISLTFHELSVDLEMLKEGVMDNLIDWLLASSSGETRHLLLKLRYYDQPAFVSFLKELQEVFILY